MLVLTPIMETGKISYKSIKRTKFFMKFFPNKNCYNLTTMEKAMENSEFRNEKFH